MKKNEDYGMMKVTSITTIITIFKSKAVTGLLTGLLLLSGSQVWAQLGEQHYRLYSVKQGKEVSFAAIAADMKAYDVLFFGEEHNDSVTHYAEQRMLEALHQAFPGKTALSLEMFDRDVQPVMDEYLQGFIREKHLLKDARVWSNYRDYRPLVEFARNNQLPVVCANAPSRYTNLAGRKGQQALAELPRSARQWFAPLPYDTAAGAYYTKLQLLTGHTDSTGKPMPAMMMGFSLIQAQSLWDATMAYSIATFYKEHKDYKVLQVNGRFHSDEGFAIVTQLRKYASKIRPLIISSAKDEAFPNINWELYKHLGDYILITDPRIPATY